jgi:spore photoproduct lyase
MMFAVDEIWIEEDAHNEPLTREILRKVQAGKVFVGDEIADRSRNLELEPDPLALGKRTLRLMKHKGAFVKPCPGTREYICCGLEILHIGQGCPMDCRYCALQIYFNRPVMEVFVNTDDLLDALSSHLEASPQKFHRICTGEFTDSLALNPITGLAERLVDFFSKMQNASLELKTKTDNIDPLLDVNPHGRVVVSFSVNSMRLARTEEKRAASSARRLAAAVKVQAAGYRIGFHFDPIIPLPGWEEEYCETIDRIFEIANPAAVAWISLGVFRFVPELKRTAGSRFGPLPYYSDGFIRGLDGKSRLFVDRRIEVYRRLAERIRQHAEGARIYLCMESPHVWKEALGISMESDEALTEYLNRGLT